MKFGFGKLENVRPVATLIIGDVMLDRYWWGRAQRISPEAPVPVVQLQSSTLAAGGAANVAANVAGLSATPYLVGLAADDQAGHELRTVLQTQGIATEHLIALPPRPTTVKTRIVAQGQHLVRLDQEETAPLTLAQADIVLAKIRALLPIVDVVILSDYAKGLLTPYLLTAVLNLAQEGSKPVLVDPKGRDYRRYAGATLITPNLKEALHACGYDETEPDAVHAAGRRLLREVPAEAVLITQGEAGMTLFRAAQEPVHLPTRARAVYEVTGAGDTVLATLAVCLGAGHDLVEAAHYANVAAGIVVEQVGTAAITLAQLKHALADLMVNG